MNIRSATLCLFAFIATTHAHLCNDVFDQARDNLAVKVDIRDGQLRINKEASFRVYLLNTMDRDIVDIRLEIMSPEFDAVVTPGTDWKGFPYLKTSLKGGTKVFFDVTLKRKGDTADGKYTIGLRLFNGQSPSMEFKTVAIADAMAVVSVPKTAAAVTINGKPAKAEWASSALLCNFSKNIKAGRYTENSKSECETRVRFNADTQYLYGLITTPQMGTEDTLKIYFASDTDATVSTLGIDLKTGVLENAPNGATAVASAEGVEVRIPLAGLKLQRSFLVNLSRDRDGELSFWRGTGAAVDNPVVFARMVLAD